VTPRRAARTVPCDRPAASRFLAKARGFLAAADDVEHEPDARMVLLVMAGIAATDAICCASLGRRSAGSDHRAAVAELQRVPLQGDQLARALRTLLGSKHAAACTEASVGPAEVKAADRAARRLVDGATRALAGAPTR